MEERALPDIIYHYTTQDGLLGILNEGVLWATKIHYMNDASELILPFQMAGEILQELEKKEEIETKHDEILSILDDINDWSEVNICVVSFCTNGDLLSQWRGYGFPGSAYAIGFDTQRFLKSIEAQPFQLFHLTPLWLSDSGQGYRLHLVVSSRLPATRWHNRCSYYI